MLVTVIKSFPYSTNGIDQHQAVASVKPQEIPSVLVQGLIADGYVCPEGHDPVAMTPHRRKALIDRVTYLFRADMEALTDEQLLQTAESAERQTRAASDADAADDQAGPAQGGQETNQPPVADDAPALIPDDWRSKHWKQRVALAKALGWVDGEPTTEQADGWISDILVHRERAAPREDLGGLSLQEVHAALTVAGVEWDADTSPADLLELYELAKAEKAGA